MANTANANTARLDRWGRPDWADPVTTTTTRGTIGSRVFIRVGSS
jgi:hypothetical protein